MTIVIVIRLFIFFKGEIMKKLGLLLSCLIFFAFSDLVYAQGPYVSGKIGVGLVPDYNLTIYQAPVALRDNIEVESDLGGALGVAVGYGFKNNIRLEGEVTYQKNHLNKAIASAYNAEVALVGHTTSFAFLANGYYDFANKSALTPFISAGIGVARIQMNETMAPMGPTLIYGAHSTHDTVFAYQIGAGISYAFSKKIAIDGTYRYFGTSDPKYDDFSMEYSSHNIYFGARYSF
jgi:opacity protein-like surface antigen